MAGAINQKEFLKKYLSGPSSDKKKKKKKNYKGKGLKIIDDNLDITKLQPLDGDELDIYGEGEDAPQIAGIIDERPEEIRKMEQFTTKWKVIAQNDGFNDKLEIKEMRRDIKEVEKDNEVLFGKMYSDSEDENVPNVNNDSDASPPRKSSTNNKDAVPKQASKPNNNSDNDLSPPRKSNSNADRVAKRAPKAKHDSDNDLSPPRRHEKLSKSHKSDKKDKPRKPSRWAAAEEKSSRNLEYIPNSDSDVSPPRRNQKSNKEKSKYDSSPHKRSSKRSPSPRSSSKSKRKSYADSDSSPPRKSRRDSPKPHTSKDKHINRRKSPDSDISPPRRSRKEPSKDKRRKSTDSDVSPPRKPRNNDKHRKGDDSDQSPPRKRQKSPIKSDSDASPPRRDDKRSKNYTRNSDSPPPTNKKMARTLEGKLAGLQDARQLRDENEAFRRREEEAFKKMTDDVSGRNAQAVSRKSKRETSVDRQKQREKEERQKMIDEKYKKWSKGVKQVEAQEARHRDFLHEAAKPLARYKDDEDLEANLRNVERADDPMLEYIKSKKRERGELGPEKPMYKGNFPPNRFNLRPGYRWDGVDRSNGYEKKYFENKSKKKAEAEDYYKWSSADM